MANNLRTVVGLMVTAFFLAQSPEATAQTAPAKPVIAVKGSNAAKPKKKARKAKPKAKPTATTATVGATAAPAASSDVERLVMAAREQSYNDMKTAMANGGSVREINGAQMSSVRSVFDNLRLSLDHTIFYQWFQSTGMMEKYAERKFTLFAPSNEAIKADPALLKQMQGRDRTVLDRFIVEDQITLANQEAGQPVKITNGDVVSVERKDASFMLVDQAGKQVAVAEADIACSNGFLNLIEGTLNSKPASIRKQK